MIDAENKKISKLRYWLADQIFIIAFIILPKHTDPDFLEKFEYLNCTYLKVKVRNSDGSEIQTKIKKSSKSQSILKIYRRFKCKWQFSRLDKIDQKLFKAMRIDPDSKIEKGQL